MGQGIFVSYRRDDSGWVAGRIAERLAAAFGDDRVFFDVLSIDVGLDYVEVIEQWIERSEIFLLVMGPRWATVEDERGRRRIEDEDDDHVFEVVSALTSGKRIIPVLVDGARMPDRADLPERLQPLVRRNAYPLSQTSFQVGIQELVTRIERVLPRLDASSGADPSTAAAPPQTVAAEAVAPVPEASPAADATEAPVPGEPAPPGGGLDNETSEDRVVSSLGTERFSGFRWPRGFLSPYFVTHHDEGVAVLEAPYVLVVDDVVEEVAPLVPLLEQVLPTGRSLLVVAHDVEGEALATLVVNKIREVLANAAVIAPGVGRRARRTGLHDLAVLTSAIVVGERLGVALESVGLAHLGTAQRAVLASDETLVIGGGARPDDLEALVADTVSEADALEPGDDRDWALERAAALLGELVFVHRLAGRSDQGAAAADRHVELCRRLGAPALVAEALTRQAVVLADGGERPAWVERLDEAAALAAGVDDERLAAWVALVRDDLLDGGR